MAANDYISRIFTDFRWESYDHPEGYRLWDYWILIGVFVCYEFIIRHDERRPVPFRNRALRWGTYILIILGLMLFYQSGTDRSFIYFQF